VEIFSAAGRQAQKRKRLDHIAISQRVMVLFAIAVDSEIISQDSLRTWTLIQRVLQQR
jgi:hypothetical protein